MEHDLSKFGRLDIRYTNLVVFSVDKNWQGRRWPLLRKVGFRAIEVVLLSESQWSCSRSTNRSLPGFSSSLVIDLFLSPAATSLPTAPCCYSVSHGPMPLPLLRCRRGPMPLPCPAIVALPPPCRRSS